MSDVGESFVAGRALKVTFFGRFSITSADGIDFTPRSAKAQGLLALLATSPNASRSRNWLQDKLWSDRAREQGAASLRQVLSEIRRSFGPFASILYADRQSVGLDKARIDLSGVTTPSPDSDEFLEGLDVRDQEFEAWLRVERSRRDTASLPGSATPIRTPHLGQNVIERATIVFVGTARESGTLKLIEELFIDCVARSVGEAMAVDVFVSQPPHPLADAIHVGVQPFNAGSNRIGLRVSVIDAKSHRLLWTGLRMIEDHRVLHELDVGIMLLGNQLIDAMSDALMLRVRDHPEQRNANYLHRLAIRKIFSMRPDQLLVADSLLQQAFDMDPRGVFLAWRAQLRAIQQVERHAGRSGTLREEAAEFCYLAMEREPSNSMVLATVANARLVFDDDVLACETLSKQSVAINPANPLAWDSLSTAKLYAGEVEAAHQIALHAQKLGATAPEKFWWDMGLCLTAALTGRVGLALSMAESSAALAPSFKPPLRYLTALYAYDNSPQKAIKTAERLRQLEPDFSFDLIAHDQKYPVSLLRKIGLVRPDKLRALGA